MDKQERSYPDFQPRATFRLASLDLAIRREAYAYGVNPSDLPGLFEQLAQRQRRRLESTEQRLRERGAA